MPRVKAAKLTNVQVLFLKELCANPDGLTDDQLSDRVGVVPTSRTLGPVYTETAEKYPESLYGMGLVRAEKLPDEPTRYIVTLEGARVSQQYTSKRHGREIAVPGEYLDPAVIAIRPTKPYGLELYTPADLDEIRGLLPDEYQTVGDDDLYASILNRRKRGAYAEPKTKPFPAWYVAYRESEHWQKHATAVLAQYKGCALDPSHTDDVQVYHRRTRDGAGHPVFGSELMSDCIPLCGSCRKRQGRFMCEVPDRQPN